MDEEILNIETIEFIRARKEQPLFTAIIITFTTGKQKYLEFNRTNLHAGIVAKGLRVLAEELENN